MFWRKSVLKKKLENWFKKVNEGVYEVYGSLHFFAHNFSKILLRIEAMFEDLLKLKWYPFSSTYVNGCFSLHSFHKQSVFLR